MYIHQTNFAAAIPITSIDLSAHQLIGVSWHILLPYTFFGVGLMLYSQIKFIDGKRQINKSHKKHGKKKYSLFNTLNRKLATGFSIF